jgi:hypothetical protein
LYIAHWRKKKGIPETFIYQSLMAASNKDSKKCELIYYDTTIEHFPEEQ